MKQKGLALFPVILIITGILLFSTATYFLATDRLQLTDFFETGPPFTKETEKVGEPGGLQTETIHSPETTEETIGWEPVCEPEVKEPFVIEVKEGEGLTHIARRAITGYMMALNLINIGGEPYSLKTEEEILSEDYISKNLNLEEPLMAGTKVEVPCSLVENTLLAVREIVTEELTQDEIENLRSYGRSVISIDYLRLIQEIVDEAMPEDGLKPIIIPVGK